ncbi:MAG: glycyl-radical enzyme activating protein [Thermodesulfobacteriota bacterium]|nr:glycyl-radical enzyme activating protein [Thermodesulfobacteriota bacterium]
MSELPLIVDVKRHSLEDGPGIRSVVFFKGCPLCCVFCQNPETQAPGPEIVFCVEECILCGACARICPSNAISLKSEERIDRTRCDNCGKCVQVCPGKGLRRAGASYRVEELGELLLRDRAFYRHSQGGVTLSGGECTLYPDYLEALLKYLKPFGVHVVLETSGFFSYEIFKQKILPYLDMIYYDLKIADPKAHKHFTGQSNKRIIENLSRLIRESGVQVIPRIPLIPSITATRENLEGIARILKKMGLSNPVLLPYNPMGISKFKMIGRPAPPIPERFMSCGEEKEFKRLFYQMMPQTNQ